MFAEKIDGRNGKWKKVGDVFPYPYYQKDTPNKKIEELYSDGTSDIWWSNPKKCDSPYKNRNYDLFAMLANVRNGSGFAGCDLGNGFIPIALPRGLPTDISPEIKEASDKWDCDGHSHSYFTVQELLDYDWDMVTVHRGWVSMCDFIIYKALGKPLSWAGSVSGGAVKHIDEAEMIAAIKQRINIESRNQIKQELQAIKDADYEILHAHKNSLMKNYNIDGDFGGESYHTQVQWVEPYRASVNEFINVTIPRLQKLGETDKVRIVFWFDN